MCGVGAAERVWKVFSFIHDRRRNRLSRIRAEKLVFLHYNLRIIDRLQNMEWEDTMHYVEMDDVDNDSADGTLLIADAHTE